MVSSQTMWRSYASALNQNCVSSSFQLPKSCIKGNVLAIQIPEDEYKAGLEDCKSHLRGRLVLFKGECPLKVADLQSKLSSIWKLTNPWHLISLGKGFFEFSFSSLEDRMKVWSHGSWPLKSGILHLSQWSPDFNPHKLQQTHIQCWVRIFGLPQEYWRPKILLSIARGIGVPISLDESTSKRSFGHFARVLVEIDLSRQLHKQILVERQGYAFLVDLDYGNLPAFCSFCQCIGHQLSQCKTKGGISLKEPPKPKTTTPPGNQETTSSSTCPPEDAAPQNDLMVDMVIASPHVEETGEIQKQNEFPLIETENPEIIVNSLNAIPHGIDMGNAANESNDSIDVNHSRIVVMEKSIDASVDLVGVENDLTHSALGVLVGSSSSKKSSGTASTQSPTTRLDASSSNTVVAPNRIILEKNWEDISDDDTVPIASITSNPVVESDMNILRKLWGGLSDDVGDPATSEPFKPVVSKTQQKKIRKQKKVVMHNNRALVVHNTRSKSNSVSESF